MSRERSTNQGSFAPPSYEEIQSICGIISQQPLPTTAPPEYTSRPQSSHDNTPLLGRTGQVTIYGSTVMPRTDYRSIFFPENMTLIQRLASNAARLGGGYVRRTGTTYSPQSQTASMTEEELHLCFEEIKRDLLRCGIIEGSFCGSLCFLYGTTLVICAGHSWIWMPSCFAIGCGAGWVTAQAAAA